MSLVAAICTQCGAQIEVDDSKEAGICKHCGTAFITEKVIKNYSINVSNATINVGGANVENLLKMAQNAADASNLSEAVEYYKRVLEIDPNNKRALFDRAVCSFGNVKKVGDLNKTELLTYSRKVLDGESDETFIKYVLDRLNRTSLFAFKLVLDFYNKGDNWKFKQSFDIFLNGCAVAHEIVHYVIGYIEDGFYQHKDGFKEIYKTVLENDLTYLTELCKERQYVDSITQGPYFSTENKGTIKVNADLHEKLLGIYDEVKAKYQEMFGTPDMPEINRQKQNSGGCYVATCVYGSYDCPQVWVLRRYRDFSLKKTFLGRLFISVYYAVSPKLVKMFGNTNWFKKMWRRKLDRMVTRLQEKGYKSTPYDD